MSSGNWSYEVAIQKLRSLQSRESVRKQALRNRTIGKKCTNLEEMENLLQRIGIPLSKLDELSVIHVAGTKGKGSTTAMCESILRHHGFRTGLYSSPHLIYERERIRINGQPISEEDFARHLQRVWGLLQDTRNHDSIVPNFYTFVITMAYYVFLLEKVDVAIVEVGLGGIVDYTNILRKVEVVGITTLELDHTNILGNTLAEIAAAKAGIMKRGCETYTVQQPKEALDVLTAFADYMKCPLTVVPNFTSYTFPEPKKPVLAVDVATYRTNASLAIQLAHAWMRLRNGNTIGEMVYEVPYETVEGLRQFRWPGRYHVVEEKYAKFYLDGAHTKKSTESCAQWFVEHSDSSADKTLIFQTDDERNAEILLQPFMNIPFGQVYFVVPTISKGYFSSAKQEELLELSQYHAQVWETNIPRTNVTVFECVTDALNSIQKQGRKPSVLVTGSLYLVGAILSIIDPNLSRFSHTSTYIHTHQHKIISEEVR